MATRKLKLNRRKEGRHLCPYNGITWRREGEDKQSRGWLNDISNGGLSFVPDRKSRPRIGDDLELNINSQGEQLQCKVVRIERLEGNKLLVGCEKDTPGKVINPRSPKQRAITRMRSQKESNLQPALV